MDTTPAHTPGGASRQRWQALPSNVKGAVLISLAALFFVIMTALIRLVDTRIPIFEILLVRQGVIVLGVLPAMVRGFPEALRTPRPWHHVVRVVLAFAAMTCGFTAVRYIPLADATALGFAKAFFLTVFAMVFLKEQVGVRRWAATIVGFAGVLIMLQPTGAAANIYGLMAVGGAAAAGLVMTLVRYLTRYDRPITILSYQAVFVGLLVAPFAIANWATPTLAELGLMVAIGVVSTVAQSLNIHAFRAGEATFLASLDYSRLLWAVLIGLVLFGELPSGATLAGAAIVIAASLYTVQREARRNQALARSSDGRGFTGV